MESRLYVFFLLFKELLNKKKGFDFDTSVEMSNGIIFTYRNGHVTVRERRIIIIIYCCCCCYYYYLLLLLL